jgi:hypothetical protein
MAKKAPAAPDYKGAAEQTAQSSKEVTNTQNYANRPSQVTPFGQENWTTKAVVDPATGQKVTQWQQNTTLNPQSQHALDSQLAITSARSDIGKGMLDRVAAEYGPTMDWSKFAPDVQKLDYSGVTKPDSSQNYYNKAGDAVYQQFSNRNEPVFQREAANKETQLRNQGLRPGDESYDTQMAQLEQQHNDARTNASLEATKAAGSEAGRMFGMDTSAHGQQTGDIQNQAAFQNTARQQAIASEMQKRGFSLNEINGLLTGQQVGMPSMPGFNQANASAATDYSGATRDQYSAAMDQANAQNATISGVAKMAGGVMGMV